ncbi:MAG: 3-phosphoshikimate 1-carboxyvinyltransferase [Flavobacteriaceae bacterium]|nr:3-phosphoshikimate 1-carboxyvinyltransferase [Flavobacteriaceae bacterium]RZW51186.1 MAG: 3-phosphoshikimate 1-carboxyvinyltransferase [Flavobacteriaceae bacterium]
MQVVLNRSKIQSENNVIITGSKSESNRALLLKALYPEIKLDNLSNSDDTRLMARALASQDEEIDIHHAGTAMRFLTAYFSTIENRTTILTGSERMKQRPIKILVDALSKLGADISYVQNEGYPPLCIKGTLVNGHKTSLKANVSSQYISALLLIAPSLQHGLELTLDGEITSRPYIKMSLGLLDQIGVDSNFTGNMIKVDPLKSLSKETTITIESDWSSASYFYSIVALSEVGTQLRLSSYSLMSLQGDSVLAEIYKSFGVFTQFDSNQITLRKVESYQIDNFKYDLNNAPDIAQTIAVTCLGLGIGCNLTGLHTLKIKETDRLEAMKTELSKFGATVVITKNSLELKPCHVLKSEVHIDTYNDHRMAMAFAPISLKTTLTINEADVVSKSYPNFWEDLKQIGITLNYS